MKQIIRRGCGCGGCDSLWFEWNSFVSQTTCRAECGLWGLQVDVTPVIRVRCVCACSSVTRKVTHYRCRVMCVCVCVCVCVWMSHQQRRPSCINTHRESRDWSADATSHSSVLLSLNAAVLALNETARSRRMFWRAAPTLRHADALCFYTPSRCVWYIMHELCSVRENEGTHRS